MAGDYLRTLSDWASSEVAVGRVPGATGVGVLAERSGKRGRYVITLYGKPSPKTVEAFLWDALRQVDIDITVEIIVKEPRD